MATTTRTIVHYALRVEDREGTTLDPDIICETVRHINGLHKNHRKLDDSSINKVHFLAYLSDDNGLLSGFFKSARYDYRPPLIDKNTLVERISPKAQSEGETELTHFAMSIDGEDVILFLEQKKNGVSISTFTRYLKKYLHNINNKCYLICGLSVKGDFNIKLKELSRATEVKIYVPTKIVTDTFGDEALSIKNVKQESIISVTAEKTMSIIQTAKDIFKLMSNHKADISRIKVYGKVGDISNTILDTNKLKDKSGLVVDVDENNQVVSHDMLSKLRNAINLIL